jgi:hypothetical protein
MLILIFELSKFLIITFNLWKDLSLNTREIKLQSPPSIPESILHRRRSSNLHTFPMQSFLAGGLSPSGKLSNSNIPHSYFCMQSNQEWSQNILFLFNQLSWFCSRTESFFIFQNSICFPYFRQKFCFVLSSNGHNHYSVYRRETCKYSSKTLERCLQVWYSKFHEISFRILVKNSK